MRMEILMDSPNSEFPAAYRHLAQFPNPLFNTRHTVTRKIDGKSLFSLIQSLERFSSVCLFEYRTSVHNVLLGL